ncbi:hypothetical protein N2152v2_010466 [Parachlorella kessleri]
MANPHPSKYLQHVEDDCKRATFIVQKLTSSKEEMKASLPRGTESMPLSELHFASGLAFTFVKKIGVGLSVETGHGFVISKLPGDSAGGSTSPSWSWSAPLFINCYAGGLGLTLGYSDIESVIVLDTPEAVKAFANTQVTLDTDITGALGNQVAAHLPATAANVSNIKLSDKTFTYSIAKGAIVDVSLTGMGYTQDADMNQALYGPSTTSQAILEGGVMAPDGMKELYSALDHALRSYYAYVHDRVASEHPPVTAEHVVEAAGAGAGVEGAPDIAVAQMAAADEAK